VRLIVVRTIVVIVPFIASLMFNAVSLLVQVFNMVARISVVDKVTQVPVVPISFLATLLRRSDVVG
jgi:hypothetical protein